MIFSFKIAMTLTFVRRSSDRRNGFPAAERRSSGRPAH